VLHIPIQHHQHHHPDEYTGKNAAIRSTVRAVYLSDLSVNILFSDKPEIYHKQFRKEAGKLLELTADSIETNA
jgi:two-component system cell cycle response regulator